MDLQKMHEMKQMDAKADFYEKSAHRGDIDGYIELLEGGNPAKYIPIIKQQGESLESAADRIIRSYKFDPADFVHTVINYRVVYAENPD